jgi:hypothetical protein
LSDARLPTELWVSAGVRRASDAGVPAYIARRGERQSGTVILKVNRLENDCLVFTQARDLDGRLTWFPALDGAAIPEAEADAYIARNVDRDPDVWVVEIEHRDGWHPFDTI